MNGMMRLVAWLPSLRRALLDVMVAEHTEHLTSNPELFDSIATTDFYVLCYFQGLYLYQTTGPNENSNRDTGTAYSL